NSKIVLRNVRELRAACAFTQSPDLRSGGFEPLVHLDVSTGIEGYAGLFQTDVPCIGNSASSHEDVAPVQNRRSGWSSDSQADGVAGQAFHLSDLCIRANIDAVEMEEVKKRIGDIFVLAGKQL